MTTLEHSALLDAQDVLEAANVLDRSWTVTRLEELGPEELDRLIATVDRGVAVAVAWSTRATWARERLLGLRA